MERAGRGEGCCWWGDGKAFRDVVGVLDDMEEERESGEGVGWVRWEAEKVDMVGVAG